MSRMRGALFFFFFSLPFVGLDGWDQIMDSHSCFSKLEKCRYRRGR